MIMSISGFVDTIPVSTLQSVSIIESEFVQAALTGRIRRGSGQPNTHPDLDIPRRVAEHRLPLTDIARSYNVNHSTISRL